MLFRSRTGNLLFVSGQIPFIAETMELVIDSVESETHQVMKNLKAILNKAELDLLKLVLANHTFDRHLHFAHQRQTVNIWL